MVAQECATSRVYNHGTLSGRLRLYLLRHLYAHACFRACLFSSTANVVCAIRPSGRLPSPSYQPTSYPCPKLSVP